MRAEPRPEVLLAGLGLPSAAPVRLVAAKRGKQVWRVETGGPPAALRVLRTGEEGVAAREVALMAVARNEGLPVPQVLASGTVADRPVLLLEWCRGERLDAVLRRSPHRAFSLGRRIGRFAAGLNRVEVPVGLRNASWIDRLGPSDAALRQRLSTVAHGEDRLLHLDLHPSNLFVDGATVTGVIDWTNACTGDGRADLARSLALLEDQRPGPDPRQRLQYLVRRVLALGWKDGYRQEAGGLPDLTIFRVWAADGLRRQGVPLRRGADRLRGRLELPPPNTG